MPRLRTAFGSVWYITDHAMDQFMTRFAANLNSQQAATVIAELSQTALLVDNQTEDGKLWFVHPKWPGVRFIVADDRPGQRPTLVTVVPHSALPKAVANNKNSDLNWKRKNPKSRKSKHRPNREDREDGEDSE